MKIIFLDIDGVLVNAKSVSGAKKICMAKGRFRHEEQIDKQCLVALNKIVAKTEAKIVVSSAWRILNSLANLQEIFRNVGLNAEIIDVTPRHGISRGHEIQEWLDNQKFGEISNFVILEDDVSDVFLLKENVIQTYYFGDGLTEESADQAIDKLNR